MVWSWDGLISNTMPSVLIDIARAELMESECRQSGHLLLCYGVRCAHLHLKHCMQELPGLYASCREVAAGLQHAYDEVEAGRLQDHPKLAALKAVLTTVSAIQPVSTLCLSRTLQAFFTICSHIAMQGVHTLGASPVLQS